MVTTGASTMPQEIGGDHIKAPQSRLINIIRFVRSSHTLPLAGAHLTAASFSTWPSMSGTEGLRNKF